MGRDLVIVGAGGFGRHVHQIIEDINADRSCWSVLGFVDDFAEAPEIHGIPILGGLQWIQERSSVDVVVAIGSSRQRRAITSQLLGHHGIRFPSLIHPSAYVASRATIGEGVVVAALAAVNTDVQLGSHVHINLGVTIGHESILHDFVTVYPNASVAGQCVIEEDVEVGSGSIILQRLSVGREAVIGAGAVVTRPVNAGTTVVGVPARPMGQKNSR